MDPRATVSRIYKEDHYTLLHTKYESSGPCGFGEEDFFYVFPMTPPGEARMDPRGTVGRNYKEDHYTLLHTKYDSSGTCGFGEEDFLCFSHYMSMGTNDPKGGAIFDSRGMVGRIYKEDHFTLLYKKYKALSLVVLEKKIFFMVFPMTPPGRGPYGPQGLGW